jgi:hypothetical protein
MDCETTTDLKKRLGPNLSDQDVHFGRVPDANSQVVPVHLKKRDQASEQKSVKGDEDVTIPVIDPIV